MLVRCLTAALLATVLMMAVSAADAEYPAALEERLESDLGRSLAGLDRALSYRVCLLSESEVLIDVTLGSRGGYSAPAREARLLFEARQRVGDIIGTGFPGLKLSELSTFRGSRPEA